MLRRHDPTLESPLDHPTTTFSPRPQIGAEARRRLGLWLAILGATAFSFALDQSKLAAVWKTGAFFDTDDAMRMVQVRDWLAWQSWWDLVAHRIDPPQGMLSHWSRVVDAVLAPLVYGFGLFLPGEAAERAARIAFPALSLVALFRAAAYAGKVFLGQTYEVAGVVAVALCGVAALQFSPGRVDHHGLQILGLLVAVATLADALDPARARRAAWGGAAMAFALGVGLENMPFFLFLLATPPLVFIVRGDGGKPLLVAFARGLAFSLVVVFVATVPPSRWFDPAPDALSIIYLTALLATCAAFLLLARLPLESRPARLAAGVVAGAAVVALTLLLFPSALQGPFAGLAPEMRAFWLARVKEMQSFPVFAKENSVAAAAWLLAFAFALGGAALGAGTASAQGDRTARDRWLLLGVVLLAGGAASAAHVRSIGSTAPLVAIGSLGLVAALRERLARWRPAFGGPAALLASVMAVSYFGVLAVASFLAPANAEAARLDASGPDASRQSCRTPAALAPLARLPAGLAIAQIDAGPMLLAFTPHAALAAPYHRDNQGNLLALHILTGTPEQAEALARASGARWLFLCAVKDRAFKTYVETAPDGLAARLAARRTPDWLKPVPLQDTPYLAFEIQPAR
jgi:hypothetical protein